MNDRSVNIEQLLLLSRTMLDLAKSGLWDEVVALQTERIELFSQLFRTPPLSKQASSVIEGIKVILTLDKELIALGVEEKEQLQDVLLHIEQGKKAVKAYVS
jgi:hypothetical protein